MRSMYHTPIFMIVPSLACQAGCKYCFGPHAGAVMREDTARETAAFVGSIARETDAVSVEIILHGGEPLLCPTDVLRTLFECLAAELSPLNYRLSMQSNLWNLTDDNLALLKEYGVQLGTSLDGPREWNDGNRGAGYFDRTSEAMARAEAAGLPVSVIATVTNKTLPHVREIAEFLGRGGRSVVLHGALAGMDGDSGYSLTPEQYADMITGLLPWYEDNRRRMRIETLDHYIRNTACGEPRVCCLRDCFGMFLCIGPDGGVTSCQRLAGRKEFELGNIFDRPSLRQLYDSPAARAQLARERRVEEFCAAHPEERAGRGGCYYNAIAAGDGTFDPLCGAYQTIDGYIKERLESERAAGKMALLSLCGDEHPMRVAANARSILALHALGRTGDPQQAAELLHREHVTGDIAVTAGILLETLRDARRAPQTRNNLYAHVTLSCNLRCTHCYASAGDGPDMDMARFEALASEAVQLHFRQLVVTGGEPLFHPERARLLEICKRTRGRGTNVVLRTNLCLPLTDEELRAVYESVDQVAVSVDGDEKTHDARRGAGTYAQVVENLERYVNLNGTRGLSLACVLPAAEIQGAPGEAVRQLAKRLGVSRIRFKPLLPLGRAAGGEPVDCEAVDAYVTPKEALTQGRRMRMRCGIGQNLFVLPDGSAYPCYAWNHEKTLLGNVFTGGVSAVLDSDAFTRLFSCTVETVARCKDCEYRYLCGGACRAWGNRFADDLNAPPTDCTALAGRAQALIDAARDDLFTEE